MPVVAPFLITYGWYSNYHYTVDKNGYFEESDMYYRVYKREVAGLIKVDLVHCTYLINRQALTSASYKDWTPRHEYVIFSESIRKAGLIQYLDNREIYGYMTFAETEEKYLSEGYRAAFHF